MIDSRTILERLQALEEYSDRLRIFQAFNVDHLKSNINDLWAAERGLQLAIECIIDIGNHIIAEERLGKPKDYTGIILILGESGVIPRKFAQEIRGIAGFRNILIHEYLKVDIDIIYQNLQNGPDRFDEFARYIHEYIRKPV